MGYKTKDEENSKMILSVLSLVFVLPCFVLIVYLEPPVMKPTRIISLGLVVNLSMNI